jgi:hypothetical protein
MKRSTVGVLVLLSTAVPCLADPPAPAHTDPFDLRHCCANPCDAGDNGPRFWGSADYLLWWVRKADVPPLVVTGSPADAFPGALDQPGTRVLFGDHGIDYGRFNGARLSLGGWLDDERESGVEVSGFILERRSVQFSARGDANGQPFLAAPFVNANTGNQNVYFISQNFADPALSAMLTGGVGVFGATRLWSWEINGVVNLARGDAWSADLLAGYRQLSLREDLSYVTSAGNIVAGGAANFQGTPLDPGFVVTTADVFRTENRFNGGQLGARIDRRWGPLALDVTGKVALGSIHQAVTIDGLTTTNAPLPVTAAVGGVYSQESNIGRHNRDAFAVIPELGVNLAVDLRQNVRARVGYTFLYVSSVVRPGEQIDPVINPNHVSIDAGFGTPGGPERPLFERRSTDFWAQGLNFGLEFRY